MAIVRRLRGRVIAVAAPGAAVGTALMARENRTVAQDKAGMRVLRRQADASWKFARVMNFTDNLASAAPVSHPCE